ncbi:MAG: hypothetical protein C0412_11615 [Flavobacterium sp.]|nr:hypothetical protein [Flavobacterium sp.]
MNLQISVIIPTYDRLNYLHSAIESVLLQTIQPYEILVCEDGSTEEIKKMVATFNNPKVKWLPGEHAGRPAIPRNRGIQAAQGDWVAFLDDDDTWLPKKLELQLQLLNKTGCLAACSNAWRMTSLNRQGLYFDSQILPIISFNKLLNTNLIISSSSLIHKSILLETGGFPEQDSLLVGEDYALWLKISNITPFCYIDEPLLEYNDEPATSIRNKGKTAEEQKFEVFQEFLSWPGSKQKPYNSFMVKIELWLLQHPKSILGKIVTQIRWRLSRTKQF